MASSFVTVSVELQHNKLIKEIDNDAGRHRNVEAIDFIPEIGVIDSICMASCHYQHWFLCMVAVDIVNLCHLAEE